MKKIIVMMAAIVAMTLVAFVPSSTTSHSGRKTNTTETLYNSEYEMTLTLYSRGSVTLNGPKVVAQGTYDIAPNNDITFKWEDYETESGFVQWVSTTSGLRVKSVVAKGITFSNTERFVVKRR